MDEDEAGNKAPHIQLKDADEESKEIFNWGEDHSESTNCIYSNPSNSRNLLSNYLPVVLYVLLLLLRRG